MKVKVCGITNLNDALVAAEAGADYIGFVFYSKSPRSIPPEQAREIAVALRRRPSIPGLVGVFVDESPERVRRIIQSVPLDRVQLHGNESSETVRSLSPYAYKAIRPREAGDAVAMIKSYRAALTGQTPAFLFDAYETARYGGTGKCGDWPAAASVAREFPILLAGGLTVQNVADAIQTVKPWGVDVSSGVERTPGVKDHARLWAFIREAKRAGLKIAE